MATTAASKPCTARFRDWLRGTGLIEAGRLSQLAAFIGYMQPYATSHDDLDRDTAFQEEVRNAARSLVEAVKLMRAGELRQPDANLQSPREISRRQ